ncbi:sensor histidine kinase [Williamwhitmania taraxaci]|uniref:histidine kinase n=1 Tax=Williamwhitmania taraxaci TaxID=1640674 RepID=A0A1G6GR35_9BACT|nr:ATP-binding protein [Williamwhitmania taraxaci]SDB84424.1 Histidine kinase-, DNA gyrase B-, and HSP90-like ATPase [Williamwhitmania taraxaci]
MVYRNFRFNIIIRITILLISIFALVYTMSNYNFFITPVIIGVFIFLQIYALFKYVDKTNRDLASFLESIRFSEFTRTFQVEGMGSSFDELSKAFNDVINDFQAVRSQKEEHFQYLQSILQNIDVAIIAFQKDGTVEMVNKAAKVLFQTQSLKNIKQLASVSYELVDNLLNITPGENTLVKVQMDDDLLQLAVFSTEFRIHRKEIILATIKNIQSVLEEQETEAWQKLISVLTHEIMNSITPIASLSSTLHGMLKTIKENQDDGQEIDTETTEEIQQAMQTIHKRSTGLLHFVNTYRNLTRIPKPNFKITKVKDLFDSIRPLIDEDIKNSGIIVSVDVDPVDIEFSIDENLIEQVLLNIVKNASQALDGKVIPRIDIRSFKNKRGRVTIQVSDNGQGILPDVLDKIFIPFFTTKPKGSGIGLSLSRQIMRLHGGSITANSVVNEGTTITMTF